MTSGSSGRPEVLTPRARALLPVFLLLLTALAVRQLWCAAPVRVVLSGLALGTTWSVTLGAEGRARADLARARVAVDESLAAVDRGMSTWTPDSELSRFNGHASTEPFSLSPDTLRVLSLAREVSERTGGAFDVTVRPLVAAWGFGAGARLPGQGPDAAELEALRQRVGFRLLVLDPAAGTARKRRPDLECDLSAIAKGFAVDQVARALADLSAGPTFWWRWAGRSGPGVGGRPAAPGAWASSARIRRAARCTEWSSWPTSPWPPPATTGASTSREESASVTSSTPAPGGRYATASRR